MKNHIYEDHWSEMPSDIEEACGTLSKDELERARGSAKNLVLMMQRKFGSAHDHVEERVRNFLNRTSVPYDDTQL